MEPFKSILLYQAQFEAGYFLALVAMSYSKIQKIQNLWLMCKAALFVSKV